MPQKVVIGINNGSGCRVRRGYSFVECVGISLYFSSTAGGDAAAGKLSC